MNGIYPEAWLRMQAAEADRRVLLAQRRASGGRQPRAAWAPRGRRPEASAHSPR